MVYNFPPSVICFSGRKFLGAPEDTTTTWSFDFVTGKSHSSKFGRDMSWGKAVFYPGPGMSTCPRLFLSLCATGARAERGDTHEACQSLDSSRRLSLLMELVRAGKTGPSFRSYLWSASHPCTTQEGANLGSGSFYSGNHRRVIGTPDPQFPHLRKNRTVMPAPSKNSVRLSCWGIYGIHRFLGN